MTPADRRLDAAILVSGRGSNMAALLEAARVPGYPVRFTRVIANRADAGGLDIARAQGLATHVVTSRQRTRAAFEAELTEALAGIDLVCLAGFMRVLSSGFTAAFAGRMINIHPSLLPAYPGLDTHARVLAGREAETGCSVHWVTAEVDGGPVIAQARVPVHDGDTPDTLAARVLEAEHATYPRAVVEAARIITARTTDADLIDGDATMSEPAVSSPIVSAPVPFTALREECGVFAAHGLPDAAAFAVLALHSLQHRGQEGAGLVSREIAGGNAPRFHAHKEAGLVSDIFSAERGVVPGLTGDAAIGHVRYSTCGGDEAANIQPLMQTTRLGTIALAHNGNLTNAGPLRARFIAEGQVFQSSSDTEVILHLLATAGLRGATRTHTGAEGVVEALREALEQVEGAYSLALLTGDALVAVRDPAGVRPLTLGLMEEAGANAWVVSSETCALEAIGARVVRDVEPGEIVVIDATGLTSHRLAREAPSRFCVFEYIYFMRANSAFRGRHAAHVRENIGAQLFRESHVPADVVIPVPESGIHAAVGYAETARLPFKYGILKSAYVGRTFIEPVQAIRNFGVRLKLSVDRAAVEGRRVLLVDDSIVRANTMPKIVEMVRAAGAREVHVRIAAPPFRYPCFYGVDTPSRAELSAANHTEDEIADLIGCDSLAYISLDGLKRAVGGGRADAGLCHACFSGQYDVPLGEPAMFAELEGSGARVAVPAEAAE